VKNDILYESYKKEFELNNHLWLTRKNN
jgi:hypothetical protein